MRVREQHPVISINDVPVSFNFEGVKLSFYAPPRKAIPTMQRIPYLNDMFIADIESIGAMKMEAMLRRSKFRDYYDIYSILKKNRKQRYSEDD